jgi:peptide/nickel transport system substrate-binding protein
VGTGPFIFCSYDGASGQYRFLANKKYYGGTPLFEEIRFIKMNADMAGQALKMGTINATAVPADMVRSIKNKDIIKGSPDWICKVMINHQKPPLDNPGIRKALLHALDREAIVKTCLRGHGEVASDGLVPRGNNWYNPKVPFAGYDPSLTHELLNNLGYTKKGEYYYRDGHILSVEILVKGEQHNTMGFSNERVAEMMKKQLESAGIKATTVTLEAKTVDNRILHWQFELALSGHGGLGGDPQMIERSVTGPGFNSSRYNRSRKLLDLFKRQGEEMNTEKRRLIINDIQAALAEEIPSLNLFYPVSYWAHDGSAPLFFTEGGIALGVPIPCNKLSFIKSNTR